MKLGIAGSVQQRMNEHGRLDRERRLAKYRSWLVKAFPEHDAGMIISPEDWGAALQWCLDEISELEAQLSDRAEHPASLAASASDEP